MATQAERLDAAEKENALQKAQIDILEAKLVLVLDYLDQRVVDRLNKLEFDLNRVAVAGQTLVGLAQSAAHATDNLEAFNRMAHPLSFIGDTVNTALPTDYPLPPRTDLEKQIVSPPTVTPASDEA